VDEIVRTVQLISNSFGGINLEDISAPRCFEVEKRLKAVCDIPVFHDDQHGTAIVVGAALINSLKLVGKEMGIIRVLINGAGSAGIAIAKLLLQLGVGDITLCDIDGAIYKGGPVLNEAQRDMSLVTNKAELHGTLAEVLKGADVFVGVSKPGLLTAKMVSTMAKDAIVFAMANPTPEIMPDEAKAGGARIVGTGRSDFDNQINNLLAFPGVFRGALSVRASDITDGMKTATAYAIAELVGDDKLCESYILPDVFDKRLAPAVAEAVAKQAIKEGLSRI